jgi:hypothetical protein
MFPVSVGRHASTLELVPRDWNRSHVQVCTMSHVQVSRTGLTCVMSGTIDLKHYDRTIISIPFRLLLLVDAIVDILTVYQTHRSFLTKQWL